MRREKHRMSSRSEQYNARRYGSIPSPAPTPAAPAYAALSPEQYKGTGQSLAFYEKQASIARHDISELRDTMREQLRRESARYSKQKERGHADSAEHDRRVKLITDEYTKSIAEAQAIYDQKVQKYQAYAQQYSPQDIAKAQAAAPKHYRTDLANAGKDVRNPVAPIGAGPTGIVQNGIVTTRKGERVPLDGSQYVQGVGRLKVTPVTDQMRQDAWARSESLKRPGIFRLSDGGAIVTTLDEGQYGSVRVQRPIATGNDGKPVYAKEPTPPTITGFNLYDQATRESIRQNAGQYKTVGEMYGAAQASYGRPGSGERSIVRKPLFFEPGARRIGSFLEEAGAQGVGFFDRRAQKGKQYNAPIDRAARWTFGAVEGFGAKLRRDPRTTVAETVATGYGAERVGRATGWAVEWTGLSTKWAAGRLGASTVRATRIGTTATGVAQTGIVASGIGGIALDVYKNSPQEIGARVPSYVAGGVGFARGYQKVFPTIEVQSISRASVGSVKINAGRGSQRGTVRMGYTARVLVNGEERQVPFFSTVRYNARRLPGSSQSVRTPYGVVEVITPPKNYLGVRAKNTGLLIIDGKRYPMQESWVGAMNRQAFFSRQGDTTYISRSLSQHPIRPSGTEMLVGERPKAVLGEFAILRGERPRVVQTGRTRSLLGVGEYNQYSFSESVLLGRPRKYATGSAAQNSWDNGGVNSRFFNEAFGLGERSGLYRPAPIVQRPSIGQRFTMWENSIAEPKYLFSTPIPYAPGKRSPSAIFEPILERGPSYRGMNKWPDFAGLPMTFRGRLGGRTPFSAPNYGARQDVMPRMRQDRMPRLATGALTGPITAAGVRSSTIPRQITKTDLISLPRTAQEQLSIPRLVSGIMPPVIVPQGPSIYPPFPRSFGGGNTSSAYGLGGTTGRRYAYAPSLVALELGIKSRRRGRTPAALFTGLELRPIM